MAAIFIFRRDLRLIDNLGLLQAINDPRIKDVLPIFILTSTQLDKTKNEYFSNNSVQFMMESLNELDQDLQQHGSRLFYFYGPSQELVLDQILQSVRQSMNILAVYCNMDYTPFARARDESTEKVCQKHGTEFIQVEDSLLNPVGSIRTGQDKVYSKFTPYFNKAKAILVENPHSTVNYDKFMDQDYELDLEYQDNLDKFYQQNQDNLERGGRQAGLNIINNLTSFKNYNKDRDYPSIPTTHLSAYIKFGTVSIREVYHLFKSKLGFTNELIKQLYWRDFYYNIAYDSPEVFGAPLKPKYSKIKWENKPEYITAWKQGKTGFPLVDAAMRALNTQGYMHNRVRMVVANFLVKLLLVDWRIGEQYFAQQLYDYDPSLNNGNWQWVAGSGADAQPYFRVFNPWTQSEKFDKQAKYIKKWIPELSQVPADHLHNWDQHWNKYKQISYPRPIIDYKTRREHGLKVYKDNLN